jgi:predicted permease
VTLQVALALVLLAGAGLFVRTLQNLQTLDPGFRPTGVLLVDFDGPPTDSPQLLVEDVRALPGIVSAALATHTPLDGSTWSEPFVPAGEPIPDRDNAHVVGVGPGFLPTLQIRLLAGREFNDRDTAESARVAVINEAFAARYLRGHNTIGQHLTTRVRKTPVDVEVVGVVASANTAGLREPPPPTVYLPYAQLPDNAQHRPATLAVRAAGLLGPSAEAVRKLLQSRLPDTPIEVRQFAAQVDATLVQERMLATLGSGFGALALLLSSVGLYGLLAYSVAQRTREIGIRMALGAPGARVIRMVLGRAALLVLVGVGLGLPAAWAASRWVQSMLFGLTPTDPLTIAGAIVLLATAAQIAAYLPARRASQVDPVTALRHE